MQNVTVTEGMRDANITFDNDQYAVQFDQNYKVFEIQNKTDNDIIASIYPDKTSSDDGIRLIKKNETGTLNHLQDNINTVYITGTGTGRVYIAAGNSQKSSFNGTRGGGDGSTTPTGEVDYDTGVTNKPRINNIVLTTGTTSEELGIDYSEIKNTPESLPADGGNADTVNGYSVESNVPADAKFTDTVYTLPTMSETIKGGAKVGSGLEVNDGVLSAKQGLETYSGRSGTIEGTVEAPAYVTDYPVNLLEITAKTTLGYDNSNIDFVVDKKSGTITVTTNDGQPANKNVIFPICDAVYLEVGEAYHISGCPSGGSQQTYMLYDWWKNSLWDAGDGFTRIISQSPSGFFISIKSGTVCNNFVFRPMLIEGTKSRGFIPYGGGTVRTCGKNLLNIPETLEITQYIVKRFSMPLKAGTYILSGGTYHTDDDNIGINFRDINGNFYYRVFPKNQQFKTTITFTADVTNFYAYARTTYDTAAGKTATLKNYMLSQSDGDFEPYKGTEIFVSSDTQIPVSGLKTFDSETNILSDFDIELKYFKDAEKAIPDAALENKVNAINTTLFSGIASVSAPAEITNYTGYKYLIVRLADNTAGVLTADDIAALTDTATAFTVGSGTYNAKIDGGVLQMWSDENLTVIGVM